MPTNRLEQLKSLLADQPDDPFLLYAIALEILPNQPAEAGVLFKNLLNNHPNYLPTYYMAAQFYAEQQDNDLAQQTYERGISLAERSGQFKALAELKNAYQNWQLELD